MPDIPNLYAGLSGYYDQFCAEVDYAEQCDFAHRVFRCFATSGGRDYLDLACGTGPHLLHMQGYGLVLNGLDNSEQMLEQAAIKAPGAHLFLSDMAELDHPQAYDLVTCFLYSIHYSHPLTRLGHTLQRVWRALKPGGVFIFNAVDAQGTRHQHMVTTQIQEDDACLQFSSGWCYAGVGEVLELTLSITRETPNGTQSWQDQHRMTAVSLSQLQLMLSDIGFDVTVFEHDYAAMHIWGGQNFNVIVVGCKPDC